MPVSPTNVILKICLNVHMQGVKINLIFRCLKLTTGLSHPQISHFLVSFVLVFMKYFWIWELSTVLNVGTLLSDVLFFIY